MSSVTHEMNLYPILVQLQEETPRPPSSSTPSKHLSVNMKAEIGIGVKLGVFMVLIIGFAILSLKSHKSRVQRAQPNGKYDETRQSQHLLEGGVKTASKHDSEAINTTLGVRYQWGSMAANSWFYETIAMCLSAACFAAIVFVLLIYNQERTPRLFYGITLNTIVSALATISKASLLFVVGECICQLRWIHLREWRHLLDVQTYNSASRGPWGSLILVLQDKGCSLATLGALITVLCLIFDPFVQQILTYPVRDTIYNSSDATIPQSRWFLPVDAADVSESHNNDATADILFPDRSRKGANFLDAFSAGFWPDNFPLEVKCPSSDCTWPIFQSVEICKMSSMLLRRRRNCNLPQLAGAGHR